MPVATHQVVLDLAGIFVFALSGGLIGVRVRMDVLGVLVMAGVAGLGGGVLRDLLIGDVPPASLRDWRYLLVPVAAGLVAARFHPRLGRIERYIEWFDALGLGLFCVTGAAKAMLYGMGPIPSALLGVLTGVGGGLLRDLLVGRTPLVLRQDIYALPALAGALLVTISWEFGWYADWVAALGAGICILLRLVALHYRWQAPRPADL
jgi:uncharacterized membrane protein YeiH